MLVSLIPTVAFAKGGELSFADSVWLILRDDIGRERYIIDNKDDTLSLDDLEISVFVHEGKRDYLGKDKYDLHIGFAEGVDEKTGKPVFRDVQAPYGLDSDPNGRERGWVVFNVYAEAKEGSGFTGATDIFEFVIIDKHSLDGEAADVNFGEIFRRETSPSQRAFFSVPRNRQRNPIVYDASGAQLDPSKYILTYFERGNDVQLSGMPSQLGEYTVRIEGLEPCYGVSYTDFDIIDSPELYALVRGSDRRYYESNTIFVNSTGSVDIRFAAHGHNEVLLVGWLADDLRKAGFDESPEPVFFDGDNNAYTRISADNLPAGAEGDLVYNWYRLDDVFYNGSYHWDEAVPMWSGLVRIEVAPESYDYLLGDADGDGEITVTDVTVVQRACAGEFGSYEATYIHGDADQSGDIDVVDATFIQRWIADLPTACDILRPMQY